MCKIPDGLKCKIINKTSDIWNSSFGIEFIFDVAIALLYWLLWSWNMSPQAAFLISETTDIFMELSQESSVGLLSE